MATHNGAPYVLEQLESIARQSVRPSELVVSDDASTDDTVALVHAFAERASFAVRLEQNPSPLGAGENFIRAALRCESELVAFSDQDDVWLERKLERCVTRFDDPEVKLVIHGWTVVDEESNSRERVVPKSRVVERRFAHKW